MAEIFVRGTLVYLCLFLLLRFVLKRESAAMGVTDLLVIVLIADAAQNAMAGGYNSVADGLLLVATIVFWAWFLDFVSYYVPAVARVTKPAKLPLVTDGRLHTGNMRKELITREELWTELRKQGIDDLGKVRRAYMESDGKMSVLTYEGDRHDAPDEPRGI